jgi:hypothetical protein
MQDFVVVPLFDIDGDITGHEMVTFEVYPWWNGVQIINVDFTYAHPDDVNDAIREQHKQIDSITFKKQTL